MRDWPDWRGETVAIVASGPSAKAAGPAQLKGLMPVVAIKKSWELVPFCDAIYGCDRGWWRSVRGLPDFGGRKWSYDPNVAGEYGARQVMLPDHAKSNELLFGETGVLGCGGNSGFQALNLVAQFGPRRILLVGFDMHDRGGKHWYGRNVAFQQSNPDDHNFRRWLGAFERAAAQLAERGVEVINASPNSEIKGFRKASIGAALAEWGLGEELRRTA